MYKLSKKNQQLNYAKGLQNYHETIQLEIDSYDRSYILYNIGFINTFNREHTKALKYYFWALERNPYFQFATMYPLKTPQLSIIKTREL